MAGPGDSPTKSPPRSGPVQAAIEAATFVWGPRPPEGFTSLEARQDYLDRLLRQLTFARKLCVAGAIVSGAIAVYLLLFLSVGIPPEAATDAALRRQILQTVVGELRVPVVLLGISLGLLALRAGLSTREVRQQLNDLEVDRDVEKKQDPWERAYRLFKAHQYELRRYYDLALRHSRVMLIVGLLCLAFGIAVIIVAIVYVAGSSGGLEAKEVTVGVLGAIGGFLAQYVAAIYLKMYAATSQALNDFHNRLVSTHHVHIADVIASKVEEEKDRDAAWAAVAQELAKQ